jgi:tRNA pseudouridine32 synthase/23S rRNA pseudouridine746 synthase
MAFNIMSRLLYRDALMLVLDKPAGLAVHADKSGGETLTDYLDDLRFGLPRRPEIVHRLDRETSGCLALGRHPRALARLNELFRTSAADKTYWALVEGGPDADAGEIDLALAPEDPRRGWRMQPDPAGQEARTLWRVLGRGDGMAWLELKPITGRTHQLRVHCATSGWPILGDIVYGTGGRSGLMLHAHTLSLPLYPKKAAITIAAPAPERMHSGLARCGWTQPEAPAGSEPQKAAHEPAGPLVVDRPAGHG